MLGRELGLLDCVVLELDRVDVDDEVLACAGSVVGLGLGFMVFGVWGLGVWGFGGLGFRVFGVWDVRLWL